MQLPWSTIPLTEGKKKWLHGFLCDAWTDETKSVEENRPREDEYRMGGYNDALVKHPKPLAALATPIFFFYTSSIFKTRAGNCDTNYAGPVILS